jgi:hypothetical protein
MKQLVVALSIGYGILGLVGVLSRAVPWLSWLNLIIGILGVIASAQLSARRPASEGGVAGAEGIAAGVLWIIALATGHRGPMAWWTFAFGVAFIITALVSVGARRGVHAPA